MYGTIRQMMRNRIDLYGKICCQIIVARSNQMIGSIHNTPPYMP